jgi:hypothetical protein
MKCEHVPGIEPTYLQWIIVGDFEAQTSNLTAPQWQPPTWRTSGSAITFLCQKRSSLPRKQA